MLTITAEEFKNLASYIKSNYGIHLKENKINLLVFRLQNMLEQEGFRSFSDYYSYLISDTTGRATVKLIDRITTNYTYFMREAFSPALTEPESHIGSAKAIFENAVVGRDRMAKELKFEGQLL